MRRFGLLLIATFLFPSAVWAWGEQGHALIAQAAAYLVSQDAENTFIKKHAYELGYYSNVPDVIWKPQKWVYRIEEKEHYGDLEVFDKFLGLTGKWDPNRRKFFRKYKKLPKSAGRVFWRVHELSERLNKISKRLQKKRLNRKKRQKYQAEWLMVAGILGHYIGDISQPLHVTENYDGKKTGQKGIHKFFEVDMVDESIPQITADVFSLALKQWKRFREDKQGKNPFGLSLELARDSFTKVDAILTIDKKTGRKKIDHVALVYRPIITERFVQASLYLATIWKQSLGWKYDGKKFWKFEAKPRYIRPVGE